MNTLMLQTIHYSESVDYYEQMVPLKQAQSSHYSEYTKKNAPKKKNNLQKPQKIYLRKRLSLCVPVKFCTTTKKYPTSDMPTIFF